MKINEARNGKREKEKILRDRVENEERKG